MRKFTRGEHILHAPETSNGDFALYVKPDGTLIYVPLKEVAP